jgi:hypothetical protein
MCLLDEKLHAKWKNANSKKEQDLLYLLTYQFILIFLSLHFDFSINPFMSLSQSSHIYLSSALFIAHPACSKSNSCSSAIFREQ